MSRAVNKPIRARNAAKTARLAFRSKPRDGNPHPSVESLSAALDRNDGSGNVDMVRPTGHRSVVDGRSELGLEEASNHEAESDSNASHVKEKAEAQGILLAAA